MGLLDGYSDPQVFADSGGMLGRLLSLRPDLAQNQQHDAGVDQSTPAPLTPAPTPVFWPSSANSGLAPFAPQPAAQDLHSQYQALRPVLGDRDAMLATLDPETGKALIAKALGKQQGDNAANFVQAGYRLGGIPFPSPWPTPPPPPIPMPDIPDWLKTAAGILLLFRKGGGGRSGRRSSGDDEEDECGKRLGTETNRCYARYDEYAHRDFLHGCKDRAKDRWRLCFQNNRRIDPSEPKEWGLVDEEISRNLDR